MHDSRAPVVLVLSAAALQRGAEIARALGGELHGARRLPAGAVDVVFDEAGPHLSALFRQGRPIVGMLAAGALIRILAPHLEDKHGEPPVLAVSEDGGAVVPLLGGHRGANDLARRVADITGGRAAITTAGDLRFGIALDAPPAGYVLANPQAAKRVMAELVAGASVRLEGRAAWLEESGLPFDPAGPVTLAVSEGGEPGEGLGLVYRPKTLALGVGAARGAAPGEAVELAERALAESGLARECLALVASVDLKADEAAVHAVAEHFGVPARFFPAARLEAEAGRLANPSEVVFAEVGCHGVAEGAALAAAGDAGTLVVAKLKGAATTAALARAPEPIDPAATGRARGRLFVVGIGPGSRGLALAGGLGHGPAGERPRRIFALSGPPGAACGGEEPSRLRSRQGGGAGAPCDGACRRGADGGARLFGRRGHLCHGDARLRADRQGRRAGRDFRRRAADRDRRVAGHFRAAGGRRPDRCAARARLLHDLAVRSSHALGGHRPARRGGRFRRFRGGVLQSGVAAPAHPARLCPRPPAARQAGGHAGGAGHQSRPTRAKRCGSCPSASLRSTTSTC